MLFAPGRCELDGAVAAAVGEDMEEDFRGFASAIASANGFQHGVDDLYDWLVAFALDAHGRVHHVAYVGL